MFVWRSGTTIPTSTPASAFPVGVVLSGVGGVCMCVAGLLLRFRLLHRVYQCVVVDIVVVHAADCFLRGRCSTVTG
jgi:hypothetical protein